MADVSRSSITLSSASYASSVFPSLDDDTASLLDRIVSRIPASRSDWKPVLAAYRDVFSELGMDGEGDTVVYGLLLRLGMERGNDWQVKWENVKRAQQQQRPPAHKESKRVDEDDDDGYIFKTPRNPSAVLAMREKEQSPAMRTATTHAQQQYQQRLTREALDKLQSTSSPYKKVVRTPLARPSKTVASGNNNNTYASHATPMVHFAKDVRDPRHKQEVAEMTPTRMAHETKEAMMLQAVQFDSITLLGRMFDDWVARKSVLQRLDTHTGLARDALLQRRSIHYWQDRVIKYRELLESAAKASEAASKRGCLSVWRQKTERKKRLEWEKHVTTAYRLIVRKKDKQLKEAVIHHWHQAFLDTRCHRFRKTTLLRSSLAQWLSRSAQLAELDTEAEGILEAKDRYLVRESWDAWRLKTVLRVREESMEVRVDAGVLRNAFDGWRERLHDSQLSDDFLVLSTCKTALSRWRSRLSNVRTLDMKAESLSLARDSDLVEQAFQTWRVAEHGKLLLHARRSRLLRRSFMKWRERAKQVGSDQEVLADAFRRQSDARLKYQAFGSWRSSSLVHAKALNLASSLSSRLILQRSLSIWRSAYFSQRLEIRKAQVARQFFLQRSCLHTWYEGMRRKKALHWTKERDKQSLGTAFGEWRERTRLVRRDSILVEGIQGAIDQRILTSSIKRWTSRVIEIRARELSVSSERSSLLLNSAFTRWRSLTNKHYEDLSLVESFIDVQQDELCKRSFKRWLSASRRNRLLQERLEMKMEQDRTALMAGCMEKWYDGYRQNQLLEEEEQVLRYRQHQAMTSMFGKWQNRTMTLPAIRFDADRLRYTFLTRWRTALPAKMDLNRAIAYNNDRLLRVTLSIWEEASRAKAARRAANRFRAFASGSNTRQRPSSRLVSQHAAAAELSPQSRSRLHPSNLNTPPIPSNALRRIGAGSPTSTPRRPVSTGFVATATTVSATTVAAAAAAALPQSQVVSASRLRREVVSRQRINGPMDEGGLLLPEAVALPPSSEASEATSAPSTDAAQRGGGTTDTVAEQKLVKKERKNSGFEEGILKEMRERLAAAGLGEGVKSRNAGGSGSGRR